MICAYCDEEITDKQYVYKYFPESHLHQPVHNSHFDYAKGVSRETFNPIKYAEQRKEAADGQEQATSN